MEKGIFYTDVQPIKMCLSIKEGSILTGISEHTIRIWLRSGRLRGIRAGNSQNGKWLIPRSELENLVQTAADNRSQETHEVGIIRVVAS
jgi:excisionase family DNA binding protein